MMATSGNRSCPAAAIAVKRSVYWPGPSMGKKKKKKKEEKKSTFGLNGAGCPAAARARPHRVDTGSPFEHLEIDSGMQRHHRPAVIGPLCRAHAQQMTPTRGLSPHLARDGCMGLWRKHSPVHCGYFIASTASCTIEAMTGLLIGSPPAALSPRWVPVYTENDGAAPRASQSSRNSCAPSALLTQRPQACQMEPQFCQLAELGQFSFYPSLTSRGSTRGRG